MTTSNRILITGGTGFLGRHLVDLLAARGADLTLLVRPQTAERLGATLAGWAESTKRSGGGLAVVTGDLALDSADADALDYRFDHVFHCAAIYDLGATEDALEAANVRGTERLLERLQSKGFEGVFHHVSSVAVAGDYKGRFDEAHFNEGQTFSHAYHRTKYESEKVVRGCEGLRYRIYRPGAVVGHSTTGVTDKADGLYYYFAPIKKLSRAVPSWFPLLSAQRQLLNVVPVDFVARAMEALAFAEGLDGRCFHLVDPDPPSFRAMFNAIAEAAGGPTIKRSRLFKMASNAGKAFSGGGAGLGSLAFFRRELMRDFGVPPETDAAMNDRVTYGAADTARELIERGVECPPFNSYVEPLWDYWARNLDPDRDIPGKLAGQLRGKVVLVTGASSGIGAEVARKCAAAGAKVIAVARREAELSTLCEEIGAAGGAAAFFVADLSEAESIAALAEWVAEQHGAVDVLINNAGRSIRRPLAQSADRFHDFERVMAINYYGPVRLTLALLPAMIANGGGQVVSVLSAGTVISPPRFGQYQASKAALNAFSDALVAEHLHEGITTSSVYMPLVKTPMVTATHAYDDQPGMMPLSKAADMVLDAVAHRKRRVMDPETLRRSLLMFVAPRFMARTLNVLYRLNPDEEGAHPELEPDRVLMHRFFGDYRI